jgi:hypothetical protein
MGIYETYTKRQRRFESAGKQDVYKYDDIPEEFRVQVVHIWKDTIGPYRTRSYGRVSPGNDLWLEIHDTLARERGVFRLGGHVGDPYQTCSSYLLTADTGQVLDIIELTFRVIDRVVIDRVVRRWNSEQRYLAEVRQNPDDAIEELNQRFKEHAIGYQYIEGILVQLDSQFVHEEIVKPALALLNAAGFDGPAEEFIGAFEHYRHGRNKEAIEIAPRLVEM